jgi:translocation and assembly module TamA
VPGKAGTQKKVDLLVEVEEGPPAHVGDVAWSGFEPVAPEAQKRIQNDWPLGRGDVFREDDWASGKRLVQRHLRDAGHATAQVEGQALVDAAKQVANLRLDLDPGPRYLFGGVDVRMPPNTRTPRPWVEEQVRLAIAPEAPFSEEALEEAQRRVFGMNVFSTARVTTGVPDAVSRHIPVVVEVREGPVHTLRLGGGGGIDQIRQEVRLISEWTNRNFLGGLRRLSLRGEVGWAFVPNALSVWRDRDAENRQGPIYTASASFDQPRLFGRPSLRGKTSLESSRSLEQTYDSLGGKGMVGINWSPRSTINIFPSYDYEIQWLNGPHADTAQTAPLALGCNSDPCLVRLSYLEQVLSWDTRDNALAPRRGRYLAISLQEGGGPLGGDFDYLRVLPEARGYLTFGRDRLTLAARLRVGTLVTRTGQESAVTTRFFTGGALGMRGFATRRLAPLLLVPVSSDPMAAKVSLPIGGNGLLEGSVEMRMGLTESIQAVGFLDFGTVTVERLPPISDLPHLLWAVGIGFRYVTPVGPLRVDFGFRLPVGRPPPLFYSDPDKPGEPAKQVTYLIGADGKPLDGEETGANIAGGCFGIGGNPGNKWVKDGMCAFHISIGEAF